MLNIRVPANSEKFKIAEFLNNTDSKKIDISIKLKNSMIACINDEIVGFVSYTQIPDNKERAILDVLLVKKEYRGQYIGDGLVKAILNLAEKRGIKRVYCIKDEKNSLFFKKVGFTIRTGTDLEFIKKYIHNHIQSDKRLLIFEAKLPEFFNKPCRSNL